MTSVSSVLSSSQITSLIQQASAAYSLPAATLQTEEQPIQAQISALGKVQSALAGLQSALGGLADLQSLTQRSVTVSPSGAVEASVANTAAAGTYSLTNIHLAQAENLVSSGFASASGSLGTGTISFQIDGGSTVSVGVSGGQDSLAGVAAAINQAQVGVQASVVFDGANYHLVLTGTSTGAADAFTVSGSGGLAGFSFGAGVSGLSATAAATNASFSLNGIAVTSGSNTVSGVVPGLTLTLAASGSATVTVQPSVSALTQAAASVVNALNGALDTINQFTAYSPVSGGGPLIGDVGLELVRTNLLDAITGAGSGALSPDSAYNSLSSVGFSVTSGGTVTLDTGALQSAAQANYGAIATLLGGFGTASNPGVSVQGIGSAQVGTYPISVTTNTPTSIVGSVNGEGASGSAGVLTVGDPGAALGLTLQIAPGATGNLGSVTVSQGLYGQLASLLNGVLAPSTGSLSNELINLNASITSMNTQIAALQQQAQQETAALTQQYGTAQATISQLTTVSDFLSTYFNQSTSG